MKKLLLPAIFLSAFQWISAQKDEFTAMRLNNEAKFDQLFGKHYKNSDSIKQNLAGFVGNMPLFYTPEDTGANTTSNIDNLQNGSYGGLPILGNGIKITLFDAGRLQSTHNEFGGPNASPARVINKEASTNARHNHATQVASVIAANGNATGDINTSTPRANAKGVLPNVAIDSYMYSATNLGNQYEKLATLPGLNISNHSYGINMGWNLSGSSYYWYGNYDLSAEDTYSGGYATQDANFDKIVYNNPDHIIVKSTGNYFGIGPSQTARKYRWDGSTSAWVEFAVNETVPPANCSNGYNCIGFGSLAKNIITVAAANQLTTPNKKYTQASDVVKYSLGSAGPRKDGAIKPDITAVGVNMALASHVSNESNNSTYYIDSGTSYAAPIVSAIAGAMTEITRNITSNNNFIYKADEMKVLLTHTANEAGRPGPDVWYGWGLVDGEKAAKAIISKYSGESIFESITLENNKPFSTLVKASDDELKVSISWVDPAAVPFTEDIDYLSNHASRLVNDLDLRVIDVETNQVYYPWKLDISNPNANATNNSDNSVDTVEQVLIPSGAKDKIYRIEVSHKGNLVDDNNELNDQTFALLATNVIDPSTMGQNNVTKKEIKIYPTRTKDYINVEIPEGAEKISIVDMNGKLVYQQNAKEKQSINVGQFSKGVYLINISSKDGITSKKFIKE